MNPLRRPKRPAVGGISFLVLILMHPPLTSIDTFAKDNPLVEPTNLAFPSVLLTEWPRGGGSFPRCEAAVRIPSIRGNPFAADVWADVLLPDGRTVRIPAFFDGEHVWKIRFTPTSPGSHRVAEFLIGEERGLARPVAFDPITSLSFNATGPKAPGFLLCAPDGAQGFLFDDGSPYFPFGQNLGWIQNDHYPRLFQRYAESGMNWSRVWMAHWTRQNLDWNSPDPPTSGTLDFEAIHAWDRIVEAAEANGVYIQVVLHHHGQYSTFVNPNWGENPWNAANGGFLQRPEDFFTDDTARRLTRRKVRYIVARWGYSPAILAWELFNEVEFTDGYLGRELVEVWCAYESAGRADGVVLARAGVALAKLAARDGGTTFTLSDVQTALEGIKNGVFPGFEIGFGVDVVARWHRDMAGFLCEIDPYHHLVTTSSVPVDSPIWEAMDYYQLHAYRSNMIDAVSNLPRHPRQFDKPVFYGEIGDHQIHDPAKADGRYMRSMLWASLFSGAAGTAQMWAWDVVERLDFYRSDRSLRRFLDAGDFATRRFEPVPLDFHTTVCETKDPEPAILAVRDGNTIAFWIYQDRAVHTDTPPVFQGHIPLPGAGERRYRVEWWDTRTGQILSCEELEFKTSAPAMILTPPIHGDIAGLIKAVTLHDDAASHAVSTSRR